MELYVPYKNIDTNRQSLGDNRAHTYITNTVLYPSLPPRTYTNIATGNPPTANTERRAYQDVCLG